MNGDQTIIIAGKTKQLNGSIIHYYSIMNTK